MLFCTVFIPVFCAVLRFSNVILYGVYTSISVRFCGFLMLFCTVFIPVFCAVLRFSNVILYGVYTSISVRFCGFLMLFCTVFMYRYFWAVLRCSYPPYPRPLLRLLSDLKFYYMHVKVSILKPILVFSSMPPLFQDLQTLSGSDVYLIFVTYHPPPTPHPQGVLVGLMAGSPEWTGLKGLKLLIALASTFQRIFWLQKNCFQADRTLKPGSAVGKKVWNGIKIAWTAWTLFPSRTIPLGLARRFFFSSRLSFSPIAEPVPG